MSLPSRVPRLARLAARLPVTFFLLAISNHAAVARQETASTIPWRPAYEAAAAEAIALKQLLWIEFTGPWCVYCRRMERETFSRPDVAATLGEGFVPVKVRSDEREDLIVRYQIRSLPAVVVLDADQSHILLRHEGYLDTPTFVASMQAVRPEPRLAMEGFDPVALVRTGKLVAGTEAMELTHDGRRYRFRDPEDREAFLADPERYLPIARGECPVGRTDGGTHVAGHPEFGVYYQGHLYLCASAEARQRFASSPEQYAHSDLAAGGLCPHCQSVASEPVKGLPQFSSIYRGLRYLFPDDQHRQAFREAPDRYIR